nr:unnamed protein product [Callosobruchus chinensis]
MVLIKTDTSYIHLFTLLILLVKSLPTGQSLRSHLTIRGFGRVHQSGEHIYHDCKQIAVRVEIYETVRDQLDQQQCPIGGSGWVTLKRVKNATYQSEPQLQTVQSFFPHSGSRELKRDSMRFGRRSASFVNYLLRKKDCRYSHFDEMALMWYYNDIKSVISNIQS